MLIEINGEQYKCGWKGRGFSYACPVIRKRGTWFGIPCWRKWSRDDVVVLDSRGSPYLFGDVNRMKPDRMRAEFEHAIRQQLQYFAAWAAA